MNPPKKNYSSTSQSDRRRRGSKTKRNGWLTEGESNSRISNGNEVLTESLLHSIKPCIVFCNIFGICPFPFEKDSINRPSTCFTYVYYAQVTYSCLLISLMSVMVVFGIDEYLDKMAQSDCAQKTCVYNAMAGPLFNFMCAFCVAYFTVVPRRLAPVVKDWDTIIDDFRRLFVIRPPLPPPGPRRLSPRLRGHYYPVRADASGRRRRTFHAPRKKLVAFLVLYYSLVFVDHFMHDFWLFSEYYETNDTRNGTQLMQIAFHHAQGMIKRLTDTHSITRYVLYVVGKLQLIAWNFTDFWVMLMAICLSHNLQVINDHLASFVQQRRARDEWTRIRELHRDFCKLIDRIDSLISPATAPSMTISVYFICKQIYLQLSEKPIHVSVRLVYVGFSVALLCLRVFGVILLSARVNEMAKHALLILRQCPSQLFSLEIQRFWDHVVDSPAAFTGAKIYVINRKILLSVISVILTYELLFLGLV